MVSLAKDRKLPAPAPNLETQRYWDGAAEGKLLVKFCLDCKEPHHYPRALCPHCFSDKTEWRTVSGKGKIYSFSVMRRAPVPYAIAYVALDEGITMMTNIVECDFDALRIGQPVTVVFKPSDGGPPVPMFKPA
jgi:uncharacterized OB-fold protein